MAAVACYKAPLSITKPPTTLHAFTPSFILHKVGNGYKILLWHANVVQLM